MNSPLLDTAGVLREALRVLLSRLTALRRRLFGGAGFAARARLAFAGYLALVAASWRAPHSIEAWGPQCAVSAIQGLSSAALRLCGVRGRIIVPPDISAALGGRGCVITFNPHGAMAVGHALLGVGRQRLEPALSAFRPIAGVASVLFKVPLMRELLLLVGGREALPPVLDAALRAGRSVALRCSHLVSSPLVS